MFLPEDTHIIHLRFKINNDASQSLIDKWKKLKSICENGENKKIVEDWLQNCKIESVKKLPYLKRSEGGIGSNDNQKNKQLRFRKQQPNYSSNLDNDIVFDNIISGENEKWSIYELDDLIRGFRRIANNYVGENCIEGCIEMVNRDSLGDYYLDNKEDY